MSLEYLLVLLCFFSVFAFLLPLAWHVFGLCLFGLDASNASGFSQSVKSEADLLSFQGNGGKSIVCANALGNWRVYSSGSTVFVEVIGAGKKVFSLGFPNELYFSSGVFSGARCFALRKVSGMVLLENYYG